ncbi:hypothetical protein DC20_12375 [Rufibacter tibetensis]|uniref:Uncharacterized protein n=1 Tax=Rufibacter tibetensis TaxID=512763 RepID=A0A0P0C475_9BACT|nr:hypothetical protein DC20_12375 [Rufibacter tibetensis]
MIQVVFLSIANVDILMYIFLAKVLLRVYQIPDIAVYGLILRKPGKTMKKKKGVGLFISSAPFFGIGLFVEA